MRHLLALSALCWVVSVAGAAGAWTEVRTANYLFFGDASRHDMRRIAQRFEQFHAVMRQVLSRESLSFPAPTIVLVFKDQHSFRPYLPLYNGKPVDRAGLALTGGDINYLALDAEGGEAAFPIVFHELAHLITRNVSEVSAPWFLEGIAEYYSSFEMRGDADVILGRPIGSHVALLRRQFMPIRDLIAVDHGSAAYNEGNRSSVFYAESWALVHYLRFNESTRPRIPEYMRLVERGTPQEQAITQAFGMDLATLEKALRSYVRQVTMYEQRGTLGDRVASAAVSVSENADAAALPHLAKFQWHVGRTTEAEQRLHAAIQRAPNSASLHAVLAQLRLEQKRPDDAWAVLQRDLAYDGFLENYLAASALGRYVSRTGPEHAGSAVISSLRKRAIAATAARSDVAEAWRFAAFAHLLADDLAHAADAIERAIALAPANERYRFTHVDVLVRQHDFARARSLLGTLLAHGRTPDVRREARETMARVVQYESASTHAARHDAAEPAGDAPVPEPPAPAQARPPPDVALQPVFRMPEEGETRVFGMLTAIECTPGGVTIVVRTDSRVLRLAAAAFDSIDFITYRRDVTGQVTCRPRVPPDPVYVTWRGKASAAGKVQTAWMAVEFTPRGYKPPN